MTLKRPSPRWRHFGFVLLAALLFIGASPKPRLIWDDLAEVDWLYSLATRFSLLDAHRVHYKTPTSELAASLEARPENEALRHLAQAQMDLGQRDKALATIEKWAAGWATAEASSTGAGWDEAARWAWSYGAHEQAFRFADQALKGLAGAEQHSLANLRIGWAQEQPGLRDHRQMRREALELNPTEWANAYTSVDIDLVSENLVEAEKGLESLPRNTPEEPALVLKAKLRVAQRRGGEVLPALDAALDANARRGRFFAAIYARAVDQAAKSRPEEWREALSSRFDAQALTRLFTYFKGQERGDACLALLQQIDRRYQKGLDRAGWSLVSSLYSEIDAVPEAFRARLAAATFTEKNTGETDLDELTRLALRAGGRPLAWGNYSDADYRWVARMDPTPGFWTGGLSLLLTGQDWSEALARLEAESIPERTFGAARALLAELVKRSPAYPGLPALKVEVMRRHVDRGEGREALALLREIEATGSAGEVQQAQGLGLLALRQTKAPLVDETRLYKAQLRILAKDGASPSVSSADADVIRSFQGGDFAEPPDPGNANEGSRMGGYKRLLDEAIGRLDERDKTHRTALALILSELDRLPAAEALWLDLASRLDSWNLDDELGPRYEAALSRFDDASWWNRLARFLTRKKRQAELQALAERVALTFRGSALFERATDANIRIEIADQPKVGLRARLVPWGDWVALKALQRFPHSPSVLRAAESRLIRSSSWQRLSARTTDPRQPAVVEDSLLAERRWAVFAADAGVREAYFAGLMKTDALEARLTSLDRAAARTPVDDLVLVEGYARLSLFEKAAEAASRLSAAYPGDESMARQALQIHRSLAGLDLSHENPAKVVVERVIPSLQDPHPFITELGELYEETGRPEIALKVWKGLLDRDPRQEERIKETAALLWDYGHMREALDTIETGRKLVNRPRMLSYEAGVLREEVKDIDGAIREYLDAVLPDDTDSCYCSGFDRDQRSLRRLAQWMGRDRVLKRLLGAIEALKPGSAADEKTLLAFWPLGSIETPTPGLEWDIDDWIDRLDQPNDPTGREEREVKREAARGREHAGIARVAQALVEKATALTPAATSSRFLSALESAAAAYSPSAWVQTTAQDGFFTNIVARQAELAPTLEERLRLEIDLAKRLANGGRAPEAEALWQKMAARVEGLPESASKIKVLVSRAEFVERTSGFEKASTSWDGLIAKYPWSLGVIEDRISFLSRNGRLEESRQALEDATLRAAEGHLAPLLTRLISESLGVRDLPRAGRALERLMKTSALTDEQRLSAIFLQARLRIQQDPLFAAVPFATAEATKFKPEVRARVFAEAARAAALEESHPSAVSLWIEALNRRTERSWLPEASRSARKTGAPQVLVSFFERQQQRSPRDVRWAVAARELRVATDNLAGGIEMARLAATIRPERKQLWDEAVELMERDQRFSEAADFLFGWNVQRPDDPESAGVRSALYIRAGDLEKAVAVERTAITAFEKTEPAPEDLKNRIAEAARRLWRNGEPQLAWRFLSPQGGPDQIASSSLTAEEQFQLALLNHAFMPLLTASADDSDRVGSAADVLGQYGRIEHREEVLDWLFGKVFNATRVDETFLNAWWNFIERSRLEAPLRFRMAQRFAEQRAGPWSKETSADLLDDAADAVVTHRQNATGDQDRLQIRAPDFEALWAAHLVRFDRPADLVKFLKPRFSALIEAVRGSTAFDAATTRLSWATWLDPAAAMKVFCRGLNTDPDLVASLSALFEERRLWDRLWALGARGWETSALLLELRPQSRVTWLSFWERPVAVAGVDDPILVSRRTTLNSTSLSLSQLLNDRRAAPTLSPFAQRLLGPAILSDVLGRDPKFTWALFQPRSNVGGDLLESGDDRITGRGIDTLRFPGALWGERPGGAWFALQAYTRYASEDPSAIDVPGEWGESGGETGRALLSAHLALALKGPAAALAQVERMGLRTTDPELLRFHLRLLVEAGRKVDATAAIKRRLMDDQKRLGEDALRVFTVIAEDFDLPSPWTLLDPAVPLLPELLASLYDREGAELARKFKTDDPVGFRAALASRWSDKAAILKSSELRVWLAQLWATGAAPLPIEGLHRLGDFWPSAAAWASTVPANDRIRLIAAIDALPNSTLLDAFPETVGDLAARRVLRISTHLARGEDEQAVSLFRTGLRSGQNSESFAFRPLAPPEGSEGSVEEEGTETFYRRGANEDGESTWGMSASHARLRALRAPFVAALKGGLIQSDVVAWLDEQLEGSPGDLDVWGMRLAASPKAARAQVVDQLALAYRRGDIAAYRQGEIVALLVREAKELAPPWIERAPRVWSPLSEVQARADWLKAAGAPQAPALYLAEARDKSLFEREEEIRAFDMWRGSADASGRGPAAWTQALKFWRDDPEAIGAALQARLEDHSFDVLSARAALRRPTPLPPSLAFLVIRALRDVEGTGFIDVEGDASLLRLRAARSLLTRPDAAQAIGGVLPPESVVAELTRRRFKAADVNSALADLARLASATGEVDLESAALDLLADRKWAGARSLRTELSAASVRAPMVSQRVVDGRSLMFRPRDLTFALVLQIVQADLSRRAQNLSPASPQALR